LQATSWQVPDEQEEEAFALEQVIPHPPQFAAVVSGASQPLAEFPSQSPKPVEQLETPQAGGAPVQFGVPDEVEHTLPHAPQLVTLVSDVSQPLLGLPSQSAKPVLQAGTHAPFGQVSVPLAFVQVLPQPPQLLTALVEVSHPLVGSPSQSA
jgi:hypothetical protein